MADPSTDWKMKYFDNLEELEQRETFWEEVESTLKRCISRLSFVGEGRDTLLDERLEALRNRVRGEKDLKRLQEMIEGIDRRVQELNLEAGDAVDAELMTEFLISLIEDAPYPSELKSRARDIRRTLKKKGLNKEVLSANRQLIVEALSAVSNEKKSQPGLLGQLLGGDKSVKPVQESAQTEGEAADLLHHMLDRAVRLEADTRSIESLREQLADTGSQDEIKRLADELLPLLQGEDNSGSYLQAHDVLLRLLDKLDLPGDTQPKVASLRGRLQGELQDADVLPVLDDFVDLVSGMRKQAEDERQEVERFLLQLTSRLTQLGQALKGIGDQGNEILEDQRALGESLTQEVLGLNDSVAMASDLGDLKQTISLYLGQLQDRLQEQSQLGQRREKDFESSISQLKERIVEMEQESETLRQQVVDARSAAYRDGLTGLYNRLAFDKRIDEEISRCKRYGSALSLLLLDADHFKKVNDNYGHKAGDKVLQVIGMLMGQVTRESDFPARYGGEEFVILLPETDLEGSIRVAEKLRLAIEKKPFHSNDSRVTITISCGLSVFRKSDSIESLFERADKALYKAKETGRNRCCTEDDLV
ncbi:MAG: diguanylate cyclase [Gammaproteobacteria bacterium]|nr:diguanylate cyclase [Gammaproteobacteria bacterium]